MNGPDVFSWHGTPLPLLDHPYNTTRENERAIEVPIAWAFIRSRRLVFDTPTGGIEVGAVLGHYGPAPWRVADRYEVGAHVENLDLFEIEGSFPWVVAISTVEHVGDWPGEPTNPRRAVDAVAHLRSLVAPGGALLVSVPFDQNAELDAAICFDGLGADRSTSMVRDAAGVWHERPGEHWGPKRTPHIWPSSVWFGEWYREAT